MLRPCLKHTKPPKPSLEYFGWKSDLIFNILRSISYLHCISFFILGATAFGVAPNALFPFELYNEEYLEQRDLYLTQCQQQLQQFIATYGPGTAEFSSDE